MRATLPLVAGLILASAAPLAPAQGENLAWDVHVEVTDHAVDLVFGPDGSLYYAELNTGQIRHVPPGAREPAPEPLGKVEAAPGGNGGFLGLALDPDFERTGAFHVYYTTKEGGEKFNRVSRLDASGETPLMDRIPWAQMHDGGRLAFGDDGKLYVTVGDNEKRDPAQDDDQVLGKIHRVNPDGSVPEDNPHAGNTLWAKGVRNPFGLCKDPETGAFWFTDNGPTEWDELNLLEKGANYGWPHHLGPSDDPAYKAPEAAWEKTFGPTGCTVLDGKLYLGDFVNGAVRVYDPATGETAVLATKGGERVLDVEAGPDGALYVGTYEAVYRLALPGSGPPPALPQDQTPVSYEGDPVEETAQERGEDRNTPAPAAPALLLAVAALAVGSRKNRNVPDPRLRP